MTKVVLRYSALWGDIDLQRQRWGVLHPRPACKLLTYNELSKWRGGGIEPHTRVVAQGFTPYCDQIVTVSSTLLSCALVHSEWTQ